MSASIDISPEALWSRVGTAACPVIVDARTDEDFAADPRLIPGSVRRPALMAAEWAPEFEGREVVVSCHKGLKISQGGAAFVRHAGGQAQALTGGFEGWKAKGLPLVPFSAVPASAGPGGSIWVTRARPKIDRIACPWLIRRFVDRDAVILYVEASQVSAVAERFQGQPFDIEGVRWSHRGERCTFDTMVEAFGLEFPAMRRLATIVRGADTGRPDLAPEAPGLLAASLGLSAAYSDDLEMLAAGMALYDAFYRWARDASGETHNWPAKAS